MAVRPSTSMEVSASRRRGVRAPVIACRGLRSEERHYRIAVAGEKSGPTSMTFPRIPAGSMSGRGQMLRAHPVRSTSVTGRPHVKRIYLLRATKRRKSRKIRDPEADISRPGNKNCGCAHEVAGDDQQERMPAVAYRYTFGVASAF
jgi:hypothetical protein